MGVVINLHDTGFWKTETWKDYGAPIVHLGAGSEREGVLASYGMVPRKHIPPAVRPFDTINARVETLGQLRSFSGAWKRGSCACCR
jgi:putative SOS response-associated peptidase YedK